jgi:hypothetical protein
MIPEIIIIIPAALFAHFSPTISNFFLKSITPELSDRNQRKEPTKTPKTSADPEKIMASFSKPSAANTAMKTIMINGLVSVSKKAERYDFKIPLEFTEISGLAGSLRNILTPR